MRDKKFLEKIKKILEKEKQRLTEELSSFAKKDKKPYGDWDTAFPQLGSFSGGDLDEERAKEIEEYQNLLPVEHALELKLLTIEQALKKIKKGTYGKCERCGKEIKKERLLAVPETRFCFSCSQKK